MHKRLCYISGQWWSDLLQPETTDESCMKMMDFTSDMTLPSVTPFPIGLRLNNVTRRRSCATILSAANGKRKRPSVDAKPLASGWHFVVFSLAVVENLWEKSKGEFVYSFSESVHPIVPQKKNPHELGLGNYFHSTLNFRLKLGSKIPWMKG